MLKSEIVRRLNESIEAQGDSVLLMVELIRIVDGDRAADEYEARLRIVRNIVRAKRELKAPMKCDFFRDIWPEAKAALLEKRERTT